MGKHDQESAAVGARRATGAATGRGRGGRFSAGRKRETGRWCTTLRLRRGSCRLSGHGDRCGCTIST